MSMFEISNTKTPHNMILTTHSYCKDMDDGSKTAQTCREHNSLAIL